jgi:hypothetical protein
MCWIGWNQGLRILFVVIWDVQLKLQRICDEEEEHYEACGRRRAALRWST